MVTNLKMDVEYGPMLCWYIAFDISLGKGIILFSTSLPKYINTKTFHQKGGLGMIK
jgi:hypothetical protein